jgi:hypothetical protein
MMAVENVRRNGELKSRDKAELETLPPFDEALEAQALGAVLLTALNPNGEAEKILSLLFKADFYCIQHREIYSAMQSLAKDKRGLDTESVIRWIKAKNRLNDGGGVGYISGLSDNVPSAVAFEVSILPDLRRVTNRRELFQHGAMAQSLALDTAIDPAAMRDEFLQLAQRIAATPSTLPPIVDGADFLAAPNTEPRQLVTGLLHQGSKLVLGGGSKTFKTWMLLDLALSVSHGLPWLRRDTVAGRVLYVNFEIQDYSWQKRIAAVAKAKGITALKHDAIKLWNLRGHAADFKTLLPQVIDQTKDAGFALIILDPIYKLYGACDENKAGDIAALLNGMEALAVQTGAAVAFGSHFSKGNQSGKEAIDRISGSGVFARDPDSILILTRHEQDDAFTVESILRNFAPIEPFAVRWQFPLFQCDDALDPAKLKKVGGRPKSSDAEESFALLPPEGLTTSEWAKKAEAEYGVKLSTLHNHRRALEKEGRIAKSRITDKWQPVVRREVQ